MWLSNSSVGRKVVMSVTGIALVLFLTFHMAMNLVALVSANGYNMVCEFLGANWYALVATVGLAALFIIHIIYAFWLTMQNRKARGSERYAVTEKPKTVEWASQNMLVLGIIVIVGLGLHLVNFWAKMQLPELMHNMGMHADTLTLAYAANGVYHIQNTFSNPVFVVLYLVWLGALWFHLTHGFWSSMQSLGWNNKVWINRWKCISNIYSTIVVLCFALVVVVFFAKFLMNHEDDLNSAATILKAVGLIAPTLILIVLQPDLSTTLSIALVFCAMMYLAGLSYRFIGTLIAILVPVTIIFISIVVQPNQPFLHDYQQKRILAWLEPQKYASDEAYQQNNAIMAIGSGQLTGKGLNNNTTTSVKNGNFISEPQTDFIFAIIGEELGFVGCCVVIILLLLIVIECIVIGLRAKDTGGRIICGGVGALVGIQTFINISVATGIFPNTGISLPFVSYGLTSLVCFFAGIGLVLNVGLQPKKYQ